MLQRSIQFVGALLTVGLLTSPVTVRASESPVKPVPESQANQHDRSQPSTPSGANQSVQPKTNQSAPLTIPAALAPYLDPGVHPDLRFDPGPVPTDTDSQAVRLEIHLSRRQVVMYRGDVPVKSYAIAIGRPGWETPVGKYEVRQMIKNPTWVHPLEKGVVIPGGDPENPLGRYWIGFWTDGKNWIGFHGTPTPRSVGRASSHGCIRMYNKDVEELFKAVTIGTVV